jgi:hypothetical protein
VLERDRGPPVLSQQSIMELAANVTLILCSR